jgi:hypothetical protein
MPHSTRELWFAFITIILITLFYLIVVIYLGGIPPASNLFGHSLGILGFILMLMTESLYTLRKRSRSARWGRMSIWLQFHIFTGLVGPYLVLLHSSWKFNGLAGIVTLMTGMVVASGFVGRYIYTAIPRTADGIEIEAAVMQNQISDAEAEVRSWFSARPGAIGKVPKFLIQSPEFRSGNSLLILGRSFSEWGYRLQWGFEKLQLDRASRTQLSQLEALLKRRRTLLRQLNSLAQARRLLAIWYAIHIPIGLALFSAAFIHMVAAIYYATLLR